MEEGPCEMGLSEVDGCGNWPLQCWGSYFSYENGNSFQESQRLGIKAEGPVSLKKKVVTRQAVVVAGKGLPELRSAFSSCW